jgi:hypothetical protein
VATLLVAAIHNGEFASSPAAEVVEQVTMAEPDCVILEVSDQAPLTQRINFNELREWGRMQWQLERNWRQYRGVASSWRELLASAGHAWWTARLQLSRSFRDTAWRTRQIEQRVTQKHIASWRSLATGDCGVALVLESDATWIPGSSVRLVGIARRLDPSIPTYLNLAGGLSETHLRTSVLRADDQPMIEGLTTYTRPVTNTSCAYLVTHSLAEQLLEYLDDNVDHASLGVDWLINAAFIEMTARGVMVRCAHAEPPVLIHGSQAGLTRSWHPAR